MLGPDRQVHQGREKLGKLVAARCKAGVGHGSRFVYSEPQPTPTQACVFLGHLHLDQNTQALEPSICLKEGQERGRGQGLNPPCPLRLT